MRGLLLALLLLPACSALPAVRNVPPMPSNNASAYTASKGQVVAIRLPSSGSGGYEWHLQPGYDTRLLRFKQKRSGELPQGASVGRFADEIFEFEGLAAGETSVLFSEYRAWEGSDRATASRKIAVTIK